MNPVCNLFCIEVELRIIRLLSKHLIYRLSAAVLVLSLASLPGYASETDSSEQIPLTSEQPSENAPGLCPGPIESIPKIKAISNDDRTHLQADHADMDPEKVSTFTGAVVIQRGVRQLEADRADYTHSTDNIDAQGHIRLISEGLMITGTDAHLNLASEQGKINNAQYLTAEKNQGVARSIQLDGPGKMSLEQATYTTCDLNKPDWQLSARHIDLNNTLRQGSANHVVVEFKGVPFLYLPYMRFPLGDERMSGFLFPTIGASDKHGVQYIIPYYWNIAPHRDATITPWYMHKRGTMLMNEFRYLNPTNQGQIELDYLSEDREAGGIVRRRLRWQHQGTPDSGWSISADYGAVADVNHLTDFSESLDSASLTYLERKGSLAYNAERWVFNLNLQSHQTLSGAEAYQRLPQVLLNTRLPQQDNQLNYHFESEWVNFTNRNQTTIEGTRLDLQPAVSLPLRSTAAFAIPKLTWRYTQYELDNTGTGQVDAPSRAIPIFSLDSGIFLERDNQWGDQVLLHTLEPQLFYAYIPYRDQTNLPVFDTGEAGFTINDPFRADRFTGADRVGDTSHITTALTTRLLSQETGAERLMARLAQIHYLKDRRVSLPGGSVDTTTKSDIIAELTTRPNPHWYLHSDVTWDITIDKLASNNARIDYTHSDDLTLSYAYRFQREILKTNEVGFEWRFNPRWKFTGRRLYDERNQVKLESHYEVRYDSCCWGLNLSFKDRYVAADIENDKAIYLALELKGLASFGN